MFKIKILKGLDKVKYWLSAESSGKYIVAEKTDVEIKYIKTNFGYLKWRLTIINYLIK